jgi:hypothetical protein
VRSYTRPANFLIFHLRKRFSVRLIALNFFIVSLTWLLRVLFVYLARRRFLLLTDIKFFVILTLLKIDKSPAEVVIKFIVTL